jgi:hypothetical protein
MMRFAAELGMTPIARARLAGGPFAVRTGKFDGLLGKKALALRLGRLVALNHRGGNAPRSDSPNDEALHADSSSNRRRA